MEEEAKKVPEQDVRDKVESVNGEGRQQADPAPASYGGGRSMAPMIRKPKQAWLCPALNL